MHNKGVLSYDQFEDSVWDRFGATEDHIVPQLGEVQRDQLEILHGSSRKPSQKLQKFSRNIEDATVYGNEGKEECHLTSLTKKNRMLEKGPWSETLDGVFQSCNSDSSKEAASLEQDVRMYECSFATDNMESNSHALSAGDAVLDDKSVLEDNVCQYPLNHMSKTDNELEFPSEEHEAKENDDILDYGWLDIENFEDVDRMFRICDSTFGMESLNNDEDLSWLSSSHDPEVLNDASKSNLKFTCCEGDQLPSFLDYDEDSQVNNLDSSVIDFSRNPFVMGKDMAPGSMDVDAEITASDIDAVEITASGPSSITSEGYIRSDLMDNIMAKEQKKQPREQKVLKGSRKDLNIQNGGYVQHCTDLKHYADRKNPYAVSSNGVLSSESFEQLNGNGQHGSLNFVQGHACYMHSDQGHALDGTSPFQTFSASKSGNNCHSSYSPKESSYGPYVESSHGHSSENSLLATNGRRGKLYYNPKTLVLSTHFNSKCEASAVQTENENEGHSKIEVGSLEPESPNVQESSSTSSKLEDVSVEATSFRQLQKVMDQLDIRTKLCIRDSLYRLAKSAEQRHNHFKGDVCEDTMPLDDARCTAFVDMETETNPIDRSIARLLFHRPSDPSSLPANHASHLKSNARDEGPPGAEQKPLMDDDK